LTPARCWPSSIERSPNIEPFRRHSRQATRPLSSRRICWPRSTTWCQPVTEYRPNSPCSMSWPVARGSRKSRAHRCRGRPGHHRQVLGSADRAGRRIDGRAGRATRHPHHRDAGHAAFRCASHVDRRSVHDCALTRTVWPGFTSGRPTTTPAEVSVQHPRTLARPLPCCSDRRGGCGDRQNPCGDRQNGLANAEPARFSSPDPAKRARPAAASPPQLSETGPAATPGSTPSQR